MNRVLPKQANWSPPALHVQPRQQEDFAEKLHTRPRKEPGPSKGDCVTTTRASNASASSAATGPIRALGLLPFASSAADESENAMMSAAADPSMLGCDSAVVDECVGSAPEIVPVCKGSSSSVIGVLCEMLTWSRVYPAHLIGSPYLSVVDMTGSNGNAPPERDARIVSGMDASESHVSAKAVTFDLKTQAAAGFSPNASCEPTASIKVTIVADSDPKVASLSQELDATVLTDHFWAERLMRLTNGSDGRSTVWLRDYALKESDFEPVATELRQRAGQEGVLIGRVVINGREIWRASASGGNP